MESKVFKRTIILFFIADNKELAKTFDCDCDGNTHSLSGMTNSPAVVLHIPVTINAEYFFANFIYV